MNLPQDSIVCVFGLSRVLPDLASLIAAMSNLVEFAHSLEVVVGIDDLRKWTLQAIIHHFPSPFNLQIHIQIASYRTRMEDANDAEVQPLRWRLRRLL